jgi:hypothetical protein
MPTPPSTTNAPLVVAAKTSVSIGSYVCY